MAALSGSKFDGQQAANYTVTAALTEYLRSFDTGVLTSIGGEIGHIVGKIVRPKSWKRSWEIHLATGFQNIIYAHPPVELRQHKKGVHH